MCLLVAALWFRRRLSMCTFRCTWLFDISNVTDIISGSSRLIGTFATLQVVEGVLIDYRSGSMCSGGLGPLPNTRVTQKIRQHNDNRLGVVYSSLHGFWTSRHPTQNAAITRRDTYSVILFNHAAETCISNDFAQSPDELLDTIVSRQAGGGTNYTGALTEAQSIMVQHWSDERYAIYVDCYHWP